MSMTCPPGWQDKSMLILSAPGPGASGVTANMVVTQAVPPADLPADPQARLNAMLDRQVAQMAEQLAGFREIERRVDAQRDHALAELRVDWHNAQARLTQKLTFVGDAAGGFIVATATAGRGEFDAAEQLFRDMLKSFRID
jgi:hypothetical protein